MTERPTADLIPRETSVSDEIEAQRQHKQLRYAERLGENSSIEMRRIVPGEGRIWDEIGKLRADVYVHDRQYLSPDLLDDNGREYDEYDEKDGTVHICAQDPSGRVVGYMRILTKGSDGQDQLPAEKLFDEPLGEDAIEISRLIARRDFVGSPLAVLALIRAAMHELNAHPDKYGKAVATVEPFLALHLDNMGIPIEVLSEVKETPEYNSSNMLVAMDYTKIVERATEMDLQRKFSPVYPERLGPWFDDMKQERGLGRIALIHNDLEAA